MDDVGFTPDQSNTDVLQSTDLNASDLTFSRNGDDLQISINGTNDTITVDWQFHSTDQDWGVESIQFADGSSWDLQDIWQNVPAEQASEQQSAVSVSVPKLRFAAANSNQTTASAESAASAHVIQFPAAKTADQRDLSLMHHDTHSHSAHGDHTGPDAHVISLEDFTHALAHEDQSTDVWYEPEPIGSVI